MTEREFSTDSPLPSIEINEALLWESTPYVPSIDRKKYADFLREIGVPDEKIERHKLILSTARGPSTLGQFNKDTKSVTIYINNFWRRYESAWEAAQDLSYGNFTFEYPVNDLLHTKRLPDYLRNAPEERGLAFAQKLLINAVNRKINGAVFHEAQHLKDSDSKFLQIVKGGSFFVTILPFTFAAQKLSEHFSLPIEAIDIDFLRFLIVAIPFAIFGGEVNYHLLNPLEMRAKRLVRRMTSKPDWQDIITIQPKKYGDEP